MLPPVIFFLSLGGVVVVMARVVVRMRQNELADNIRSVVSEQMVSQKNWPGSKSAELLKPSHKSVRAIRSRTGLVKMWLAQIKNNMAGLFLRGRRSLGNFKFREKNVVAGTEDIEGNDMVAADGVIAPQRRWRGAVSAVAIGERVRMAADKVTVVRGNPLGKVREKIGELKEKRGGRNDGVGLKTEEIKVTKLVVKDENDLVAEARRKVIEDDLVASDGSNTEAVKFGFLSKFRRREKTALVNEMHEEKEIISTRLVVLNDGDKEAREPIIGKRRRFGRTKKISVLEQARQALSEKKYQQAEDYLVSYIMKHTKDTQAYMMLGRCATERGKWDEAVEIFQQVVDWNSNSPGAYAELGFAAFESGSYTKALTALQRGHEADPENGKILRCLLTIAQRMDNLALQDSISDKLAVARTSEEEQKIKTTA